GRLAGLATGTRRCSPLARRGVGRLVRGRDRGREDRDLRSLRRQAPRAAAGGRQTRGAGALRRRSRHRRREPHRGARPLLLRVDLELQGPGQHRHGDGPAADPGRDDLGRHDEAGPRRDRQSSNPSEKMSTLILPPKLLLVGFFGPGVADEKPSKELLGGKAYSLMTMTQAGLPVPPGFTITTQCCAEYYESGKKWPKGLEQELRQALDWLEQVTGRKLGSAPKPLLVAVRSGAAQSMPGMMDTVLNVGLRPELASCAPNAERFWGDLRDFVRGFGEIVCGLDFDQMEKAAGSGSPEEQARHVLAAFERLQGKPFPTDPWEMLSSAVSAVFESWNSERAIKYRDHHNVRGLAGTAVTVMTMFPSERSGILFTEDPNRPDQGRIIIEASYGLGEAIVRGHVEPDIFCVDRKTNAILEKRVNTGK